MLQVLLQNGKVVNRHLDQIQRGYFEGDLRFGRVIIGNDMASP